MPTDSRLFLYFVEFFDNIQPFSFRPKMYAAMADGTKCYDILYAINQCTRSQILKSLAS